MKLRAADLFCGAGGTSSGARATGGVSIRFGLNHWSRAIETHSANFPEAKHVNSRLEDTHPSECDKIDLLFASPECTHHSRARGGRPTSDQQRSGAWHVLPWIEHHRPSWVVIENVSEWKEWGPVGANGVPLQSKRGAFFDAWLMAVQAAGYKVDYRELNAADFDAATSRNRLFVIARKGNRNPVFPEPTRGKHAGGELPGMAVNPWRAASEVINWSIPCPSIFGRSRPLADKTLLRIEAGLRRFVGPFVSSYHNGPDGHRRNYSINESLPVIDTSNRYALVQPYQVTLRNNCDATDVNEPVGTITAGGLHHGIAVPYQILMRNGQTTAPIDEPLHTLTAGGGHHGIALPFVAQWDNHSGNGSYTRSLQGPLATMTTKANMGLVVPFLADVNHGGGESGRTQSVNETLGTVTTKNGKALCLPWISPYYGNSCPSEVTSPIATITTKERHSLCVAQVGLHNDSFVSGSDAMRKLRDTMRELGVSDIGFRMLSNSELALAQGFPGEYIFHGTKSDITRQIGNSVSPPVAEAITRTILSV